MRTARKLTPLAMLAIAATTLAAPSAFAQTSTEPEAHNQASRLIVQQEVHAANDTNCPLVTPSPPVVPPALPPTTAGGGCRAHASGLDLSFRTHDAAGIETLLSFCNVEIDIRVDVAGEGYLTHQELTPGAACNHRACGQVAPPPPTDEGRIWSFFLQESEVAGSTDREHAIILFCIEHVNFGIPMHCEVKLPLSQGATHRYVLTASDVNGHAPPETTRCELNGTLHFEPAGGLSGENLARQNIEVRHT
jgi:hypothetical protein